MVSQLLIPLKIPLKYRTNEFTKQSA